MENPIVRALSEASASRGSTPLITWYDPQLGSRTELSVRTFANWVDKTANLIAALDATGTVVVGAISVSHPGHWMSLIWPLAAWQQGCRYSTMPSGLAELMVTGPEHPQQFPPLTTLACSLHPLGVGLSDLPEGILDFTTEALAQPDVHVTEAVNMTDVAWTDADREVRHSQFDLTPQPGRVLVQPTTAWDTLCRALLRPLLGGGSAVIADGPIGAESLQRLATTEKATI